MKIIIQGELPDLNSYIKAMNSNRFVGNHMKQDATDLVAWSASGKRLEIEAPYHVTIHWFCKDKRKDKDNIAFGKKFILDGLQRAGTIEQDTWKVIDGFTDIFHIDKENPRIEIIIESAKSYPQAAC